MAKTVAPLLSFDARGKIADTQVYSNWRGVPYVRRYVVPGNPKTTGQVLTRDVFRNLDLRWKQGPTLMRAPWDRFAVGQKFVGRNSYLGKNINALRGEADMALYIGSPGAKGGLPPTSMVVTPGVAELVVTVTEPALPAGWTIQAAVASCLKDQTPEAVVTDIVVAAEDLATPFSITLAGLDTVLYQVQAWLRWVKPDSSIAYGASIVGSGTPT